MIRTVESNRSRREEENEGDLGIACDRIQWNVISPMPPATNTTRTQLWLRHKSKFRFRLGGRLTSV